MTGASPRPATPMGEAWFMGAERKMYPQLFGDLDALPDEDIMNSLEEIASGLGSFGLLDEWIDWYHYLLPRLVNRKWQPTYYQPAERLFTAFMNQHSVLERGLPYTALRADALDTLGRSIMSPRFWPGGELDVVNCLSKWTGPNGTAGWCRAGNLLSASLFFCIKFLKPDDVEGWFRSAIAIPDRYWQVQIITWLVGAHPVLTGEIRDPSEFPEIGPFDVSWDWSHALNGQQTGDPFLPVDNRAAIIRVARGMDVEAFLEDFWTDPMTSAVAAELAGMPEHFFQLYRADTATK